MDKDQLVSDLKEAGLAGAKAAGEVIIVKMVPHALDFAAEKIPGGLDDMIIAALKPHMEAYLKEQLAKV